jgi:hypothetical protein
MGAYDNQEMTAAGGDNQTLKTAQKRFSDVKECSFEKGFRTKSMKDLKYFTGEDQGWDEDGSRNKLLEEKRPALTLNRVAPIMRLICGARPNPAASAVPVEENDLETAEVLNACKDHTLQYNRWQFHEDDWFLNGIVKMRDVVSIFPNFDRDVRGEIELKRLDGFRVYLDPNAKEKDRSDGEYMFVIEELKPSVAKAMWPKQADYIDSFVGNSESDGPSGQTVQRRQPDDYDPNDSTVNRADYYDSAKRELSIPYYWYKEYSMITRVVDLEAPGSPGIWDSPKSKAEVEAEFEANIGPDWKDRFHVIQVKYTRVKYLVFCHDIVFEEGITPWERPDGQRTILSDNFPYVVFEPERLIAGMHDELTSILNPLEDPQKFHNKLASAIIHIIGTSAGSGAEYESGAFENTEDEKKFQKHGSQAGYKLKLAKGGLEKFRRTQPGYPPQAHMLYAKELSESLLDISGVESMVSTDSLGKAASGMAIDLKQRQGGNIISWVYKSFRFFQYVLTEYVICAIQRLYDYEKVIRIMGTNPRYVKINEQVYDEQGGISHILNDVTTGLYDVVLTDKDVMPTMRMERFKQFTELVRNGALPLPPPVLLKIITTLLDDPELRKVVEEEMANLSQQMSPMGGAPTGAPGQPATPGIPATSNA